MVRWSSGVSLLVAKGAFRLRCRGFGYRRGQAPKISTDCGRSSVVERQLPKLYVVGSIPIARSNSRKELLASQIH
jgi:hypothetical protein